MNEVRLGTQDSVFYIGETKGFEDVKLLSLEGEQLSINSCVFASISHVCFEIVDQVYNDPFAGEDFYISTNFSSDLLKTFISFANHGTIADSQATSMGEILNNLKLKSVFEAFGIVLSSLNFNTEESDVKPYDLYACLDDELPDWMKTEPEFLKEEALSDEDSEDEPLIVKANKRKHKLPKTTKTRSGRDLKKSAKLPAVKHFWFPQEESLRDSSLPFQCHLCTRGFNDKESRRQHLRRHEAKSTDEVWFCFLCDGVFKYIRDLRRHKKKHHKANEVWSCPKCNYTLAAASFGRIESHLEKHNKLVICRCCGKDVGKRNTRGTMTAHLSQYGKYHDAKCRLCPDLEEFKSWDEHKSHLDEIHNGEFQFKCGECPDFFNTNQKWRIHRKKCTKVKHKPIGKFVCDICGISYRQEVMHRHHQERVHGTDHLPCDLCGKVFKHPNALERHKDYHQRYTCEICGKSGAKKKYVNHMTTAHTPNHLKPYVCPICNPAKGFASKGKFEQHMNVHTGNKPFKCSFCPAQFASSGTLGGHIRGTHKNIKRSK